MLAQAPLRRRDFYGLAGRVLAVETDDEAAAQLLSAAYTPANSARPLHADHSAMLRRLPDGRLSAQFDRAAMALGQSHSSVPLLSAYYAAREVFARFAAAHPESIALYGCVVSIDGNGLLILGPTTIGKTVLALHLASQGAGLLGDETAVLDFRSATIAALARKPSLRESALAYLPHGLRTHIEQSANVMQTDRGRFWYAIDTRDSAGIAPSRALPLRAVCIVQDRAQSFSLHRTSYGQALPAMLQRAYARPARLAQLSALRRSMRHTAFFDLHLGDPEASAAALLREVCACE